MLTKIPPTIGRIVHYEHEGQTLAAIVTNVVGDNIVNLQIFKDGLGGCYFHEGVEMGEGEGQWRWPLVVKQEEANKATVPIVPTGSIPAASNTPLPTGFTVPVTTSIPSVKP